MPIYEYQCENCGAGVEFSRPIADRNIAVDCENPDCFGDGTMKLVPSLTAFSLKGDGWTPKGPSTPPPPRRARRSKGYDMTGDRDL